MIALPDPVHEGTVSLEETLKNRRSIRSFSNKSPTLADVAQILWASQGITSRRGYRTAPSAGALYPLEIYLVAGRVESLDPGVYSYQPHGHELVMLSKGDKRDALGAAALGQRCVSDSAVTFVVAAVYERTAGKYGSRAGRYIFIEVGHASQNILLQAVARGLGTVMLGAFDDAAIQRVLGLPQDHVPLALIPAGYPKK